MQDKVRAWVDNHPDWPNLTKSIAKKWLDEGLQDRSITRDLSWGIPVTRGGQPLIRECMKRSEHMRKNFPGVKSVS